MHARKWKRAFLFGAIALLGLFWLYAEVFGYKFPPRVDAIRSEFRPQKNIADTPKNPIGPSSSKSSEASEGSTFKPPKNQYSSSLLSIVSGVDEIEKSIAADLMVDQDNIKLVRVNYEDLIQVSDGDTVTVPTTRGDVVDFYISNVDRGGGDFVYIEGHLEGYDSGYLLGLTVGKGGAIDGVYLTDVGKYRIYTINGQEVLEKAENLPDEVYH